jgi:exopolyphosphatase/guanosine-5'-triphosphate,3'-diphosphate pyrophosphatase
LLNGYQIELGTYRQVFDWLMRSRLDERLAIPGILPMRAELVVVGALLVQTLIEDLSLERLLLSMYSLKEGMIFDYIEQLRNHLPDQGERTLREDGVRTLLKKFYQHDTHPDHVSRLALMIFDQTKYLHNYGPWERELLHYSALLHDIGQYIHRSGHHKHGQYIIQNANLPGFNSDEIVLLSNVVRYHRKSLPSREHFNYNLLYKEHKLIVNKLAGMLRIADNLDRTHQAVVKTLDLKFEPNTIVFILHTRKPASIEIDHAQQNAEFFCSAFTTSVRFEQKLEMC